MRCACKLAVAAVYTKLKAISELKSSLPLYYDFVLQSCDEIRACS
jgi:hypothetical protein